MTRARVYRLRSRARLGRNISVASAAEALFTWRMHRAAGVRVTVPAEGWEVPGAAFDGQVIAVGVGPRWLGLAGRCRVIAISHSATEAELVYRTLPGHVEDGLQRFRIFVDQRSRSGERLPVVRAEIVSYSRPATLLGRLLTPLSLLVQKLIARRYLRALGQAARLFTLLNQAGEE